MQPGAPFLKWPGGKRWLTAQLCELLRGVRITRYFEPFLGGGALFFALRPRRARLSDINSELINTYEQVRDNHDGLVERLRRIPVTAETYYAIRGREGGCAVTRATHFLYLNRTAFAGMYRLNQQGRFNVPYGGGERTPNLLWEKGILAEAARTLRNARLTACDFEVAMRGATAGDVIYCDPTYTVAHDDNGFIRYNERNFSWRDQERLAAAAQMAAKAGAVVIVSNAHHPDVASLHRYATRYPVLRYSSLARSPDKRRAVEEYLFVYGPL
jgi:DNA adenine methylase